jgi:hypothetical protein
MKFNIGDKVFKYNEPKGFVYEITHITKDGYYVCESDKIGSSLYGEKILKLYEPPVFSYFHPTLGLHKWEIVSERIKGDVHIRSITNPKNIFCNVPVALVEHYLGDTYVK